MNLFSIAKAIPYTFYFNFRYLPFKQAIHLPIWLASNAYVKNIYSGVIIDGRVSMAMIRIGFHENPECDIKNSHTWIDIMKGGKYEANSLIAGRPARIVKKISGWEL